MCVKDFISLLKHTTTLSPLTNCFRFRDACVCVCVHARARVCVCVCVFSPHKTPRSCSRSPLSWGIFIAFMMYLYLKHTATHCNTLKHTATHCNTLQHTATHCHTVSLSPSWCICILCVYHVVWKESFQEPFPSPSYYRVATVSRIDKILGLFCKRAL